MKELGYGKEYQYAHDYQNNFVEQNFLPKEIEGTKLYEPGQNTRENEIRNSLKNKWKNIYDY